MPATARLGGGKPRRPAEPCGGGGGEARLPGGRRRAARQQIGTRVMAWWRARVVAPVRRAWLAVAAARARARNGGKPTARAPQLCSYVAISYAYSVVV